MKINEIRNALGKAFRKIVVWHYRMLGVQIGQNVFISHKAKIDTTYRNSIVIGDNVYVTYGAIVLCHDHSVYRHTTFSEDDGRGGGSVGK